MEFSILSKAVTARFQELVKHHCFRVAVDKDALWTNYLRSFPEGTNPIFKERTEHDCQCCKSFIRAVGNLVAIDNGKLLTIWDVQVGGFYQVIADTMAALVKSSAVDEIFLHTERTAGIAQTRTVAESGQVLTWNHFYASLPSALVVNGQDIGTKLGDARSTKDVFARGLQTITLDSVETVLDLIAQKSLYRGAEHKFAVEEFRKLKLEFVSHHLDEYEDRFVWSKLHSVPASVTRIRNTSIGTLLVDLSEGKDLTEAVLSFESKVAPTNYKRPTALVTKAMIQKAQATIEELGFTSALDRRYATIDDITINNILFANRESKKAMNVFDELASKVPEKVQNLDKVEEVSIDTFLSNILPKAESVEVLFENKHAGNLVSLIAPVDPDAKNMFKWPNNFSWSYTGELTDSIKERVKNAGGKVDGDFRASLSWFNYDDLDLHLMEPNGNEIYYADRHSRSTGGQLDVDMNAGSGKTRTPVENIFYPTRRNMKEGIYHLIVNQFNSRETTQLGFDVELEFDGQVYSFSYPKKMRSGENVTVAEFKYTHKNGIELIKSLPSLQTSKSVWGVSTQRFHKVNVVMHSPNHWDNRPVGNKHYFFMLDGCLNEGQARGFFNEFLTDELGAHRKVFEFVGAKMKTEESDRQLSGLGFSSTQRNSILCRVKGSFARTIKITF